MRNAKNQEKQRSKETKQSSESDSEGIIRQEFKIAIITMLRALMEKIDNIQEQIYNVKRWKL